MSRIGLNKRLREIFDVFAPEGSFERRFAELWPHERDEYVEWKARCDAYYYQYTKKHGPCALYEQYLESGDLRGITGDGPPELRLPLRRKLFLDAPPRSGDPQLDYERLLGRAE